MNIIEAVKSGKRFKRKDEDQWWDNDELSISMLEMSKENLLREDWEIEEEKIEPSWEQISMAVSRSATCHGAVIFKDLKKELGFKE